jgi:hypothetical protein
LRTSSSRSAINVGGMAMSRKHEAHTSASSEFSARQYGQFMPASWRHRQGEAHSARTAIAIPDIDPHEVFARRQFGLRHVDSIGMDERLDSRGQIHIRRAEIDYLTDSGLIVEPPKDSNFSRSRNGECASPLGETTSTFGPRNMPRRSAATAPFGGGSLASSAVINCAACAAPEVRRPAATRPSHVFFITRLPKTSLQYADHRTPPSPMIVYGAQNNGWA